MALMRTARLLLRAPVEADLERFYAIHANPRANLFNPAGPMASRDVAQEAFATWLLHWERHGYGQWAVATLDAPDCVIGFGGLARRMYGSVERVNLGYRFDPACWGAGYASELAAATLAAGFALLHLPAIFALVRPAHGASIRVLEKTGMQLLETLDDVPAQAPSLVYVARRSRGSAATRP